MAYYIRFLKTPAICESSKASITVTSVVSITTDLGDISFCSNVELIAELVDASKSNEPITNARYQWTGNKRTLNVFLACDRHFLSQALRVHVTTPDTQTSVQSFQVPKFLDTWSATFGQGQMGQSAPLVERQFALGKDTSLRIWEETGNSIARHIW